MSCKVNAFNKMLSCNLFPFRHLNPYLSYCENYGRINPTKIYKPETTKAQETCTCILDYSVWFFTDCSVLSIFRGTEMQGHYR